MNKINLIITVIALAIIGWFGFQYFSKLPKAAEPVAFSSEQYGYSFMIPGEYAIAASSADSFVISSGNDPVMRGRVAAATMSSTTDFRTVAYASVEKQFCAPGAKCKEAARSVPITTKENIQGEFFTLKQATNTTVGATTTTTTSEVGPFLVFNISKSGAKKATLLLMKVEARESVVAGLIEQIVETLKVEGTGGQTGDNTATSSEMTISTMIDQGATGLGVKIVPLKVLEDSRCPVDVQCIQAGTVRLSAILESASGSATTTFTLGKTITTEAENVTLSDVLPATHSGESIPSKSYRFIFTVSKR